jgi:hypothetical protein
MPSGSERTIAGGPIQELLGDSIVSAIRRAQGPMLHPPPGVPPRSPRDPDRPARVEEPPSPVPIPRPEPHPVRSPTARPRRAFGMIAALR